MSKKKVKLCLASPVLFPPRGGAELRFLRYLPGLQKRGVSTRIVTGTPKAKKLTNHDTSQKWYHQAPGSIIPTDPFNGAPIDRVRLPDKTGWRRTILFNQMLLRTCNQPDYRPDVVQMIAPLPPRSMPWLLRLKKLGIATTFAYTLPDALPSKKLKRMLQFWSLRMLYQQLDCIVASSDITRDIALEMGLKTRIEVIPNGVNLERFRPGSSDERSSLRKSLGIDERNKVITTVGAIIPRKGIDLLLEAWVSLAKRFPDIHLMIIGPRTDKRDPKLSEFHHKLTTLVDESGASDRVHFTGRVENVESYLRISDIFVFPSQREGMGNVVLEAMASGLPVVLTPYIGLPKDFGKPGHHYLLADRNPDAIAAVITELMANDELCAKLGRKGRRWVEETMDIEHAIDQYAALYHELAEQGK